MDPKEELAIDSALEVLGPMILIQAATWEIIHPNLDFELDIMQLISQLQRYVDYNPTKKHFVGELVSDI